ncbi:MAG: F0F1 ATP synthase subunit gamma [Sphingomonadaceae bacterium]|uniref:F0F1 ATP synthase subunit gamma n=1 Tax=Thermaurantiacus sp. TaxID=2820283 RepID=UPI00298F023D|nr:F0F1 ATP synthase subunit gamma [Thermaurantiacus sp.]MCS6985933.1 F0F1 ATP synthase subunit gamma [Sphingomonadaceae bacterium]MDW8414851.1 F0F1 ATP synthase subunit gamma [Thermaurantiacus sp.]
MPSLKSLKLRIASVRSTQKITRAMNLVATAKLRGAQAAALAGRPFAEGAARVIGNLAVNMTGPEAPKLLTGTGRDQTHLLVVVTSERGLCGAYNANIVRLARRRADDLLAQGRTVKLYVVGRKGRAPLQRTHGRHVIATRSIEGRKILAFAEAKVLADDLIARFSAGEFDVAHILYAYYRSALVQVPTEERLIPVRRPEVGDRLPAAIEFEPSPEAILTELLPRSVAAQIYQCLLEARASEEGARMTAMDSATRNAGEMLGRLTLTYNRTRQAAITKELIEIISGAEAV